MDSATTFILSCTYNGCDTQYTNWKNTHNANEVAGKPCGPVERFLLVQLTDSPAHVSVQEHSWHASSAANQEQKKHVHVFEFTVHIIHVSPGLTKPLWCSATLGLGGAVA